MSAVVIILSPLRRLCAEATSVRSVDHLCIYLKLLRFPFQWTSPYFQSLSHSAHSNISSDIHVTSPNKCLAGWPRQWKLGEAYKSTYKGRSCRSSAGWLFAWFPSVIQGLPRRYLMTWAFRFPPDSFLAITSTCSSAFGAVSLFQSKVLGLSVASDLYNYKRKTKLGILERRHLHHPYDFFLWPRCDITDYACLLPS